MKHYCYLNGEFVEMSKAKVSVQDRGFRFGDGVFETISAYHGIPYQWELHMERLKAGLKALSIPADTKPLRSAALKLISKNGLSDATIRIAISRGVGGQGYLPAGAASSTVVIEANARQVPPVDPATLWLTKIEKTSPKAMPVQFKLSQGLNSTLARLEAAKHGCLDSLLLNADGEICEAGSANVFWLKEGVLHTPAIDCGVLEGTTRSAILRISPYETREGRFTLDDLAGAEAMIVTNSHWIAAPIAELKPDGAAFPESPQLAKAIRAPIEKDIANYVESHRA